MHSKPTTRFFVALVSAVLLVPLGASGIAGAVTSAFQPANIAHPGGDDGNLYEDPSTIIEGQQIKLTANFTSSAAGEVVTIFKETSPGDFTSTGKTDEANSYGNAYIPDYPVDDDQKIFARAANGEVTEIDSLDPEPGSAVLDPNFTATGTGGAHARAKAAFAPAQNGASAQLQVKSLKDGSWDTIKTGSQDSNGDVLFTISNPLEVKHQYRAVSNGVATTNSVVWAGPLLDKGTGVATVHFNSNDGESVNTRTKNFDGEFAMKAATDPRLSACKSEGVFKDPAKPVAAQMKGRGNYSWTFPKKSFTLKLDKGKNLCGMGDAKKWALVANDYDRSLFRNAVASELGKRFTHLEWTPDQQPVDLYVNGSYRGAYSLVERVTATGTDSPAEGGRVPITEAQGGENPADVGYIMEWDFRKGAFHNFTAGGSGWIGLKEPEDEEYSSAMGSYINSYVDKADAAVRKAGTSDSWMNYVDVSSAVDYYLAMEFLKPVDGNMWASVYMYKPQNGKITFGPLWDFDLSEGSANRAGNVASPSSWYLRNALGVSAMQSSKTWFNYLNESASFRAAVKTRWNQVDQGLHMNDFIATQKSIVGQSAAENFRKWSHGSHISKYQVIKSSWSADVEYLRSWMESRLHWMNGQLDNND